MPGALDISLDPSSSSPGWPAPSLRPRPAPDEQPGHRARTATSSPPAAWPSRSSPPWSASRPEPAGWHGHRPGSIIIAGFAARRRHRPLHGAHREDDRDAAAGVAVQRGGRRRGRAGRDRRLPPARRHARGRRSRPRSSWSLARSSAPSRSPARSSPPASSRASSRGKPIMFPGGQTRSTALAIVAVAGASCSSSARPACCLDGIAGQLASSA